MILRLAMQLLSSQTVAIFSERLKERKRKSRVSESR